MENHSKYGRGVYYHNDKTLWIKIFMASQLTWKSAGMTVRQTTKFPDVGAVRIEFGCKQPTQALIKVRHPFWSLPAMEVRLNGKPLDAGKPGSYLDVSRLWNNGDTLEINLKMPLWVEHMAHHPATFAMFAGPSVLAAILGDARMNPPVPHAKGNQYEWASVPDPETVPQLVTGNQPVQSWLNAVAGKSLRWQTHGVGRPHDFTLVPFYKVAHERYVVYFNHTTQGQWLKEKQLASERIQVEKLIYRNTIDCLIVGDVASMKVHRLRDEVKSNQGRSPMGRWIDARNGGGFTFNLKVLPNLATGLPCTYWGSDGSDRVFNIMVDGVVIASQTLNNIDPGKRTVVYPIPGKLTHGKKRVSIRLQAAPGMIAGGLFGARSVKLP